MGENIVDLSNGNNLGKKQKKAKFKKGWKNQEKMG